MRKFFCKFVLTLVFCSSFALANNSFITLNPSLPNSENSVICKGYFKKEHVTILNNFSKNPK